MASAPLPHLLQVADRLKFFLATAPATFPSIQDNTSEPGSEDRAFSRFLLPSGEHISCVVWNGLYHITGTDIVRALYFRFQAFGRNVRDEKKFQEGVFSNLRALKDGTDATLEEPKSELLHLLSKHEYRDLKRERRGIESTTEAGGEPALSFRRDPRQSLFEQVSAVSEAPSPTLGEAAQPLSGPAHPAAKSRRANIPKAVPTKSDPHSFGRAPVASTSEPPASISSPCTNSNVEPSSIDPHATRNVFGVLVLKGAPTYKQHVRASGRTSDRGAEVGTVNPSPSSTLVAIAKTYVCSESDCGISFKRSEHRSRHERTHTGEQPFACPTCAKSFSRRDNMSAHIKTHAKKAAGRVDVATDSNEEVESERSSSSTGGSRSPLIEDGSGSEERRRGMSASSSRRVASLTRSPAPGANTRDVPRQTPLSTHHSVRHDPYPSSSRPRSRTSAEVSTPIRHNPSFAFGYPAYEASGLEDLDSSSFSDYSVGSHLPSSNALETASGPARAAEGGASDFGAIGGSGGAGAGGAEERMEVDGEV